MYENLKPDFKFQDTRGQLIQLVHKDYKQINILITKRGVIRGGHYHKISREAFYLISGSVDVAFSKFDIDKKTHFEAGDFFEILPYTIHTMSFPEDCIMVVMYDVPVEDENGQKDIYLAEHDF